MIAILRMVKLYINQLNPNHYKNYKNSYVQIFTTAPVLTNSVYGYVV